VLKQIQRPLFGGLRQKHKRAGKCGLIYQLGFTTFIKNTHKQYTKLLQALAPKSLPSRKIIPHFLCRKV